MSELTDLSSRIIDEGITDEPTNRITNELSELGADMAMVESFSHSIAIDVGGELVVVDTSASFTGAAVVDSLRSWSTDRISHTVYTHGHIDHVGGSGHFAADAEARGHQPSTHVGHERVEARFDRYDATSGWNLSINNRQFGGLRGAALIGMGGDVPRFLDADVVRPDLTYADQLSIQVGDETVEFHHSLGETDDHTWCWFPDRKLICAGDFFIWHFPNAGNPQKVQRYPSEWAQALRTMAGTGAELFVPSHGLPIAGANRIRTALETVAGVIERLVADTLEMMNADATLDEIIHSVGPTADELAIPYLTPMYDEPEFVVRNIWRRYGGWWDGNPANLKPSPWSDMSTELAQLAGGWQVLAARASELSEAGDHRLASHLAELAVGAAPEETGAHAARAETYRRRIADETSLMSKGIYSAAVRESRTIAEPPSED